ncbi:MAG: hypothetical protein IJ223_07080 [Clostridia bacterium]|nr:hypothetical protein [Clostridia bacterium]
MEELLKQIMGEAYKEDMTQDDIQSFFKNQVLGSGNYVNKSKSEAEIKKLQDALDAKNLELQNKMTDDEKKAAADQALKDQLEELQQQLLAGKISNSEYKAMSITSKSRLNSGIADDDKEFGEFISSISTEDEEKTSKIANYINTIVEKAYEKGKADMTKNKLGGMGNFNSTNGEGGNTKTEAEERAERLAKNPNKIKKENSYFN